MQLHRAEATLSSAVTLTEAVMSGSAPRFQDDGFVKPDSVALVAAGLGVSVVPESMWAKAFLMSLICVSRCMSSLIPH